MGDAPGAEADGPRQIEPVTLSGLEQHVIDASRPDWESQVETVNLALEELGVEGVPTVHVFNKVDLVGELDAFSSSVHGRFDSAVLVSAATANVSQLVTALTSR